MILITGSLAFDFIMNFPGKFADHILPEKIHTINLSFLVKDLRRQRGGCAANIAYNLALLGEKPAILGVLGRDGGEYKKWLKSHGVDVSLLRISRSAGTASAFIMTDSKDNQITGFYPGAMAGSNRFNLQSLNSKPIRLVIIAPNPPQIMISLACQCQQFKLPYLFDPGMQLPRLSNQDLKTGIKGAKLVIGNDYEMSLIKRRVKATPGARQVWITTLGERGSMIDYHGKMIEVKPAKPKNVTDPTGAGDAYRAGFVYGYLRGDDLKTCGQLGGLVAVYTVEKYGTTTHTFTKKGFEKRYRQNFAQEIKL